MKILLTFVGNHDPAVRSAVKGEMRRGPILVLAQHWSFDRAFLFATENMRERSEETKRLLQEELQIHAEVVPATIKDPTAHKEILMFLRAQIAAVTTDYPDARLYAATASGTPQMHFSWLALAASGEFPGRLLQLRDPGYVTDEQPLITELDLSDPVFPRVVPNALEQAIVQDHAPDAAEVMKELGIIGSDPGFLDVMKKAAQIASNPAHVLITGETGTGKELLAKLIHRLSFRKGPLIPLNCSGLSEQLVESELFGYVKGAFTGASRDKQGLFEAANGGTLFLDEIGDLPTGLQAKLLRALQESRIRPVGATVEREVDVRIISATNVDLRKAVHEGSFRQDLFYRIHVVALHIPPLRERRGDIPKLAQHILAKTNAMKRPQITPEAVHRLVRHNWPGNIRELVNVLQRAAAFCTGGVITENDICFDAESKEHDFSGLPEPEEGFSLEKYLGDVRTHLMYRALDIANGNQSHAAKLLGISPAAVCKFLKSNQEVE